MSYQFLQQIRREVLAKNVTERPLPNTTLSIFKYSQHCVMENAWNDVNRRCRGIVFDTATGTLVARPFDKFFNLGERPETETSAVLKKAKTVPFRTTEKLDGSMCSVFYYSGHWMCATPGALDSDQARYATTTLLRKYDFSAIPHDVTLVCEMISPTDRECKVVLYGERDELVLISAFENRCEQTEIPLGRLRTFADASGLPLVPEWKSDYETFLSLDIPTNTEGYVIAFDDGLRIKVKSIAYLKAFRLLSEFSTKHIFDYIESGDYRSAVQVLPEHLRRHFDDMYAEVMTTKGAIELEAEKWRALCDPADMKKSAEVLEAAGPIKSLVFMMLRNKTEEQRKKCLWKMVRARFEREAEMVEVEAGKKTEEEAA